MFGRKKKDNDAPQQQAPMRQPTRSSDPSLPGSAGYRRRAGKGGMPDTRFNYVRPDSKRNH